ncbi:MAG: ATP-binding protein, partial [Candidatus Krumholzibacteria bacterium]|nr:ATP-binding protein [Candidatus Krumholzibacteria bacterium]
SSQLVEDGFAGGPAVEGKALESVLDGSSLRMVRSAMSEAKGRRRGIAVISAKDDDASSIPLKAGHLDTESGEIFLLFGNRLAGLSKRDEWEKNERLKELACLYGVAELIEVSSSVGDFFTRLPSALGPGMLYPDDVVIYSRYQGIEYGAPPGAARQLAVKLVVAGEEKGEVRVGYDDDRHELLPEEQKMLDEIGRMLNLALERKEFREKLVLMEEEEEDYNRRLAQLRGEIESKTKELEEQKSKLAIVDSYLDRVKDGWEESKARLETMFKAIPDDVVLIDKKRKVVMTNREDIEPGNYCYASFFGRDVPCEDCRLARILRDKTPVTLTMKFDDRYFQVHALPVYNQDHEVDGILEFYRDITLEKTYDQQLQQADKLASIGQLVSGIGHEINNPNQFIRGNIKIIQQSLEDMLPIVDEYARGHPDMKIARLGYDFFRQHIMTLVDDMAHGSERIKAIVEGLRTFTRKDEGLLVDKVDINTIVETATRLVSNEVHKYADVDLDLAPGLPTFTGNSQKIEQVLINLIVNAGQAMPEDRHGTITVRTRLEKGRLLVEVADDGKGMNESTLKQIFNPFFTTKRAKGGTGLGLAIAYRIIEEHGGAIAVRSRPGAGTTFSIRLPAGRVADDGGGGDV